MEIDAAGENQLLPVLTMDYLGSRQWFDQLPCCVDFRTDEWSDGG